MVRDGLKTLSFAVLHFSVGFGVTYALTGSVRIATGVALLEPLANTVVFFFHERLWRWFERPAGWKKRMRRWRGFSLSRGGLGPRQLAGADPACGTVS